MKITLNDLFNIPTAEIYNPDDYKPVSSVVIDSRKCKKNSLFVAIKGNKYDGHNFVEQAVKNGASAVMVIKRKLKDFDILDVPVITVKDTLTAYGELAKIWRLKSKAKVISITGSNGKTTTKEILFTLLKEKYKVIKSIGNNNNHIGVPLSIFSATSFTEIILLEHGTNHFGEIKYTAGIAQPDYGIITNIGNSHLEFLKNREGVFKEKSALFTVVDNNNGTVFINQDDPVLKKNAKNYKNIFSFGFKAKPDVKGCIMDFDENGHPVISVSSKRKNFSTTLPLYGKTNAENYLAAVSVAIKLNLTKKQILDGTKKIKPFEKRLEVKNFQSTILIDDTYNSNPVSMQAALDVVKSIKKFRKKTLILGDMFELGEKSEIFHKKLAENILKIRNVEVLLIGKMMKNLAGVLKEKSCNVQYFKSRKLLINAVNHFHFPGKVVLVKGSRGMKMEEFVNLIERKLR